MSRAKAQLFLAFVAVLFQSTFASLPDQSVFDFLLSRVSVQPWPQIFAIDFLDENILFILGQQSIDFPDNT